MKVSGRYQYLPDGPFGRPTFVIGAQPHLMLKLKRHIPAGWQDPRTGNLYITATKELARDLDAFLYRHPLQACDQSSSDQLGRLVAEHRAGEEQIARIFEGEIAPFGTRQPLKTPRDYQLLPRSMVLARGYLLLGDGTGLGKTLASSLMFTDSSALRGLVVAPTHIVRQWERALRDDFPWLRVHRLRQGQPYKVGQKRLLADLETADVILSNYHKLGGWGDYLKGNITTLIFDEAQELRTGYGTGKYTAAMMISHAATYRMACTATPVYNNRREAHRIISVLDPDVLGTEDEFATEWTDSRALGTYLRDSGIMLRRTRKDVGRELPPVSVMEQPVETDRRELDRLLADGIVAMAAKVIDQDTSAEDRFKLSGQFDLKLRQATGVAKAPFVAAFVEMLLESGEKKVALVGHHHDVYDIWRRHLRRFGVAEFTGLQSEKQKDDELQKFIHGDARVLLMAVRSGSGTDGLQAACSTIVFGEPDWVPAVHDQLIDRFNRDGQPDPVAVFFMISDAGSDPPMFDTLDVKRRIAQPVTDPDAELVQATADEAVRRVQKLAKALLRQHGINPNPAPPAEPDPPAGGELFPAAAVTGPSVQAAVDAAADRAETVRLLGVDVPHDDEPTERHRREDLRGRLAGARR